MRLYDSFAVMVCEGSSDIAPWYRYCVGAPKKGVPKKVSKTGAHLRKGGSAYGKGFRQEGYVGEHSTEGERIAERIGEGAEGLETTLDFVIAPRSDGRRGDISSEVPVDNTELAEIASGSCDVPASSKRELTSEGVGRKRLCLRGVDDSSSEDVPAAAVPGAGGGNAGGGNRRSLARLRGVDDSSSEDAPRAVPRGVVGEERGRDTNIVKKMCRLRGVDDSSSSEPGHGVARRIPKRSVAGGDDGSAYGVSAGLTGIRRSKRHKKLGDDGFDSSFFQPKHVDNELCQALEWNRGRGKLQCNRRPRLGPK